MPDYPTPTHMDPAVWATYAAAHEQAEAARYAAELAAQAALDAAWLQIKWGLPVAIFASIAALIAAGLTYRSAIKAAQHQTMLETEKHEARVTAYAVRQWHLIDTVEAALISARHFNSELLKLIEMKDFNKERFEEISIYIAPSNLPEDWDDKNWEEHALLGKIYVRKLIYVRVAHRIFDMYKDSIKRSLLNEGLSEYKTEEERINDIITMLEHNGQRLDSFNLMLGDLKNSFPDKYKELKNPF